MQQCACGHSPAVGTLKQDRIRLVPTSVRGLAVADPMDSTGVGGPQHQEVDRSVHGETEDFPGPNSLPPRPMFSDSLTV